MCKFKDNGEHSRIDECIEILLTNLYFLYEKTNKEVVASCCGHKKYPMTIIIKNKKTGHIYDMVSNITIPRKRNFYKKDKQGYYYIPEIIK
jgi:hypothetical protein